jgi:hypothetical protein
MTSQRTHHAKRVVGLVSAVITTGAVALTGPVAGASAATLPAFPTTFPTAVPAVPPVPIVPLAGNAVGGNQIGSAGCVGTNRPSVGGNNGSTAAQTCGAVLSFTGAQIGQISSIVGPTIIGSPLAKVIVSAGSVTGAVQTP